MKLFEILSQKQVALYSFNGGNFHCQNQDLISLDGTPSVINGNFDCYSNELTSLLGGPVKVTGEFDCSYNKLTSLKGSPLEVGKNFNCCHMVLTSLNGATSKIGKSFYCFDNNLKSLEGSPSEVGEHFDCSKNDLNSLKNVHKIINKMKGAFIADGNPIKSHILGVLLIDGCKEFIIDNKEVGNIINKYLPNKEGMAGVLKCQEELFAADLDEYAQL